MDNLQLALELQEEGYSLSQIAEELGTSKSSVHRLLKQHEQSMLDEEDEEGIEEMDKMDTLERSTEPSQAVPNRPNSIFGTSQSVPETSQKPLERSTKPSQNDLERSRAAFQGYWNDEKTPNNEDNDDDEPEEVQEKKVVHSLSKLMNEESKLKDTIDELLTQLLNTPFFDLEEITKQIKKLNKEKNNLEDFIYRVTTLSEDEDLYKVPTFLKRLLTLLRTAKTRLETWDTEQLKSDKDFYYGMINYEESDTEELGVDFWKYQKDLKKQTEKLIITSLDIV